MCYNTQGSFTCQCKSGYYGDGFYCSPGMTFDIPSLSDGILPKQHITVFCSVLTHSLSCYKFILRVLGLWLFTQCGSSLLDYLKKDFHFHSVFTVLFILLGHELLSSVYWCQLEPVSHFHLDSKRNLSNLIRNVGVFLKLSYRGRQREIQMSS